MQYIKNTAGQYVTFTLLKAADHTALTGATIGSIGKFRTIDGAAQASMTGTITETANGQYQMALSQADTNGTDIGWLFTYSTAIPVQINVTTTADVNVLTVAGATQTPGDIIAAIGGVGTAGGAAINTDANTDNSAGGITGVTSGTTKLGTIVGSYTATSILDGNLQTLNADAGQTTGPTIAYQFLTGGGSIPIGVVWTGYVQNTSARSFNVQAWDHVGAAWETIGNIVGSAGTTNVVKNFVLYQRHAGTSSAELGKVYLKFIGAGSNTPRLFTDQVYINYAIVGRTAGYQNGTVWVDTVNGESGTTAYINGTADRPCNTWANALAVAAATGLSTFNLTPGSSITLTAALASKSMVGTGWSLALGGQDVSGTFFAGAHVTGTGTTSGDDCEFENCRLDNVTVGSCHGKFNTITGTFTCNEAGDYSMGLTTPYNDQGVTAVDLGSAVGSTTFGLRAWGGAITLKNVKAGDAISMGGEGRLTIDSSCTGGTIDIRGQYFTTNNGTSTVLVSNHTVGYEGGYVWVDTVNGYSGASPYVNGISDRPCLLWADALTIAASIGLTQFRVVSGSTITLTAPFNHRTLTGDHWILNLGGQNIGESYFSNCRVFGSALSSPGVPFFEDCVFNGVSLDIAYCLRCTIRTSFVVTAPSAITFLQCGNTLASPSVPIDLGAAVGTSLVAFRDWHGSMTLSNVKAGDIVSVDGNGSVTLDSSCTGGTVKVRGGFELVDNSIGTTVIDSSRSNEDQDVLNVTGTVATLTTYTGDTPQSGDAYALIGPNGSGLTQAGLSSAALADVLTQIRTALATDTIAELVQGTPPVNPTLAQAAMALYMALRNELTVSATMKTISNDAGIVIFKKGLSDDSTTFTETEAVSGP